LQLSYLYALISCKPLLLLILNQGYLWHVCVWVFLNCRYWHRIQMQLSRFRYRHCFLMWWWLGICCFRLLRRQEFLSTTECSCDYYVFAVASGFFYRWFYLAWAHIIIIIFNNRASQRLQAFLGQFNIPLAIRLKFFLHFRFNYYFVFSFKFFTQVLL